MAKESKYARLLTDWERLLAFVEGKSEGSPVSAFWEELIGEKLPVEPESRESRAISATGEIRARR
jgi:hypothetical protein